MKCYIHPDVEAVATCRRCGRAICDTCSVDVGGQVLCPRCVASAAPVKRSSTLDLGSNPLATISLVLGILGLAGCACGGAIGGLLFGVPAAITGWIARRQLAPTQADKRLLQLATIGLALGVAEAALALVILIVFGSALGLTLITDLFQ